MTNPPSYSGDTTTYYDPTTGEYVTVPTGSLPPGWTPPGYTGPTAPVAAISSATPDVGMGLPTIPSGMDTSLAGMSTTGESASASVTPDTVMGIAGQADTTSEISPATAALA